MIVDSSAVLAMMLSEPEGRRIEAAVAKEAVCRLPAAGYLESSMILISRIGPDAVRDLDLVLQLFNIQITPFTEGQARLAREAFRRYGKGRHAAQLNFGDCMAHALARESGEELLFKGTDFAATDVAVAAY
jgi:ribonuclease VapC